MPPGVRAVAQQTPISFTAAQSTTVAIVAATAADRNGVHEYVLTADSPVTLTLRDTVGNIGVYRMNSTPPPVVVAALGSGPRAVALGTISLVVSTSCVVAGHITLAGEGR